MSLDKRTAILICNFSILAGLSKGCKCVLVFDTLIYGFCLKTSIYAVQSFPVKRYVFKLYVLTFDHHSERINEFSGNFQHSVELILFFNYS